jgi:Flp pilus assembly protein TadB
MLSDREQQRLREIQRQFMSEDPDFVREFDAAPKQPTTQQPNPRAYVICAVSALVFGVLLLLVGSLATALMLAIGAGLIWSAWRPRRARHTPSQTEGKP